MLILRGEAFCWSWSYALCMTWLWLVSALWSARGQFSKRGKRFRAQAFRQLFPVVFIAIAMG